MLKNCYGLKFSQIFVALCMILASNANANAEDAIDAPKIIVVPRMVTVQAAWNAEQGGQQTLITSNGVFQGSVESMRQFMAHHSTAPSENMARHAAISPITTAIFSSQSGAVIRPIPPASGAPVGASRIGGLPTNSIAVSGQTLLVSSGSPISVNGSQITNWQSFNISASGNAVVPVPGVFNFINLSGGSAAEVQRSGGLTLNSVQQPLGATSITGTLVSNGQPYLLTPTGVTTLSGIPSVSTGVITLIGTGAGTASGTAGLAGVRPVTPITVR